jgi:hypothetical protein
MRNFFPMPRIPKKKQLNIFKERFVIKVGGEEPVVYPPGHLLAAMESLAPPSPELEEEVVEIEQQAYDDYNIGRLEENGPEEDTFPAGYDEADWDVAPEPDVSNHTIYRLYDVFIHKSTEPYSSQQLYVMHDFQSGPQDEITIVPNRFAVVAILNVIIVNNSCNLLMVTHPLAHAHFVTPTHSLLLI